MTLLLVLSCSTGCASLLSSEPDAPPPLQSSAVPCEPPPPNEIRPGGGVVQTRADESATPAPPLFAGSTELTEAALVEQAMRRNPTIAQMSAAVQIATARYPQATSLDDPRLSAIVGPASIGSRDVDFAYRLEITQALPFPGKLGLRGAAARGEAAVAIANLVDARLQLAEAARNAFVDYYLSARAAAINDDGLKLLNEARDNAQARYRNGQGEQQDVLQAEVAIARQRERSLMLQRRQKVAQARINAIVNQAPDVALPPPPPQLGASTIAMSAAELRELAIQQRPDMAAINARVATDEAALALAIKEYYPDVEAMAAYDAFWQAPERDLRPMLGVRVNLPVQIARRDAAVVEARARIAQRRAELARLTAQIGLEVQEAFEQTMETDRALRLYEETTLPKALENVKLAQSAYANAKVPFFNVIEAQRNLNELRERQVELIAESRRRRAALDRAIGNHSASGSDATALPPVRLQSSMPN